MPQADRPHPQHGACRQRIAVAIEFLASGRRFGLFRKQRRSGDVPKDGNCKNDR
jgi:hypothetical protein